MLQDIWREEFKMIYKTTTTYPLETVKAQLEKKAEKVGFGVLGSYEFKKILKAKGFEIHRDVTVYELCNPAGAEEALNAIAEISVYLPCRISVYSENGLTVLATIGMEDMLHTEGVDEAFKGFMEKIFDNIRAVMNSW